MAESIPKTYAEVVAKLNWRGDFFHSAPRPQQNKDQHFAQTVPEQMHPEDFQTLKQLKEGATQEDIALFLELLRDRARGPVEESE
jgi:hypothetical protein